MWVLVGAILGARLMYVIVEVSKYWSGAPNAEVGQSYVEAPWEILYIWKGGLVMYGGFFGAALLGLHASRKAGLRLRHALDLGLIGGFVGQGIGRWGCYLVGDDYGSIVPQRFEHLTFPLTLRVPSLEWLKANPASLFEHELAGQVLWATQIWESANAFAVAGIAYLVLRKRRYAGQVSLWVFALYATFRFLTEMCRGDALRGVWFGGQISTSQLISLPVALIAFALLWLHRKRVDPART
jgi:phosphatidylglycerol:prolipoprotein diacylglycerol transferase